MQKKSAPSEHATLGATRLILGVLSIVGVVWTSASVPAANRVDFAVLGTWAFFVMNAIIAAAGGALVRVGRSPAAT